MRIESVVRVDPRYVRDPKAVQYAIESVALEITSKWLREFPNSTLLLRRPREITKDTDDTKFKLHTFQATATVLNAPQFEGEHLLSFDDLSKLLDKFYSEHRCWPNTLLLPPNFRIVISGEWMTGGRSPLDPPKGSNEYWNFCNQFKIVENAPMLAVALL